MGCGRRRWWAAPPEKVGRVGVAASEKVGREVGRDMGGGGWGGWEVGTWDVGEIHSGRDGQRYGAGEEDG